MAQSIQFAVRAPLDLQDEQVINVSGIDFTDSAVITGTVDFAAATVQNLDISGDTTFEAGSSIDFTGVTVTGLNVSGGGGTAVSIEAGTALATLDLTGGIGIDISAAGVISFNANEVGLNDVVTSAALTAGLATKADINLGNVVFGGEEASDFRTLLDVDIAGTDNSGIPTLPSGIDTDTLQDYVLRLTDSSDIETLSWRPVDSSGQTVTDQRLPSPVTGSYIVGNGDGTAWTNQTAEELLAALNIPTGDVTTAQLNAETTARIEGDKLAEDHINAIDFDTVSAQTGIHLSGTGPTGGELIKVSDTLALEQSIQEAYFSPSSNTLTIVLLPDTATLDTGQWTLADDQGSGSTTIAQFPDADGHPLVAGYESISSPDNESATLWEGNILRTHWNGRQFYLVFNVTGGVSDIEGIADPADTFGDRDITGTADITSVFRNVFSITSVQTAGVLRRDSNGNYSYDPTLRATLLGVIQANFTAAGLIATFNQETQSFEPVTINKRDAEYDINGFSVRNAEYYAIPGSEVRFHLLASPDGNGNRGISETIFFDAVVQTVVDGTNEVDLTVSIINISPGIRTTSVDLTGGFWLIAGADPIAVLSSQRAAHADRIHTSYLPEDIGGNDDRFTSSSAVAPFLRWNTTTNAGWENINAAALYRDITPVHYDFSADLPLTIGELQAETNYEITYTLPVDATSIQIDFRGQPQSIYNNPTFTTTTGTHTVLFQFVNNANFQTLVTNAPNDPVYTGDEQGFRVNVDGVFYNVHLRSTATTDAPNNYVTSGSLTGANLTLNRRGLDSITVGGFPTPFTVSNPNGFVQADDFSINPEGDILTLPNGSMFESGSSVARWDVASDVPLTASEIIDETALPTGVTRWEDRTWEVSVTIPDTITGPLLLEFHALTHEVAAAGPIIAGTYTYTFTFADFGSNVTSFIEGLGAGEATYGTESSNLRVRTSDYSEVHYAHFGSGALHPTSDHYVINGRVNTSNELELDIKGLGINAVTIGLDNSTVAVDGTTITGDGTPASPLMATNVVNTNNVPNNHIPVNLNGEFHSSGVQLDRPQLLSQANEQWFFTSQTAAVQYDFIAVDDTRGIELDEGDSFDPNNSALATYAFRDATGVADALLFRANDTTIANELAGETINDNGAIHTLAIPVNVSLFERNAADNFAVLGPFTRYQWLTNSLKLFPAAGSTLADIHTDGGGVVPARDTVSQAFGAFTFFIAHNDDFITSVHKIRTDLTVATDHDRTLATKSYVDTVAGTGVPFVSQELFTAAFNFAYTLEQFNQVFDRTLAPLNTTAVTTATITPVLDGNDFVGNGAINTALNEYQNASSTVLSADERAAIVAAVDGIPESSPGAGDEILADGGALITFALSTGEEVPLFVQKNPNDDRWFWIHGGLPQAVTINAIASVSYFDTSIPTFNDVNRLPFALISQPIDGVTQTVAELETIISDALGRGEVLEFSNDNFANVSTVTSANIMEDAFGRYYRLEFSEPYEGSFAYEDVGAILRLRTAQRDQVITSGSLSGAVAQDGTAAYVPGALYRETGFDADDTYFDVQPITVDGSHIDFKVTDKNGGGNFDQLSINIPELENLNVRVSHLEQGGTSGGSEGPGASYTPGAFKLFPSPWLNGSNELSQAWNNHRLSYLFRIPNAEIRTNEPANNAVLRRQVANFSYRNTGWRNTFGHEFRDTITHGTTRINPGRDLFRVLELSYLGETSEIFLTTQTIQNNTFSAAGFNNDNQRRDVTYQADGGYRADFFMNFGTPFTGGSINHELTLGITRVASSPTGAASYYEIRGGAFPQEITLTSGTGIFIAYLAKTPREGSQLGGVRNETTTAHGTFSVGVDATNRNPNFDETGAFGNEIRLYGVTQEQIDSTVGTFPMIENDGTVTDEGTGWRAGGDGSGIFTGGNNGQATRTVSLTGIFRQREIPGSAIDNTSMIAVTYTAPSNERNEGANVEGRSTTLGFEGTFRWLSVRLPLTDYDTSAALLYANIDTFGLNPITVREVWTSGTGTSSLDLHTLANTRVTILFPDPIDETWLSDDTPDPNTDQVLTYDTDTNSIVWETPTSGIVEAATNTTITSIGGDGYSINQTTGEFVINTFAGVSNTLGSGRTGVLPGPGANNGNNFLRGDGTWQSIGLVVGDDNVASTNIIPRSDGVAYVGSTLENEIVDVISGAATEVNYENVDSSLDVARTPSTGSGFLLDGLFTPRTGAITADVTNSIIFETIGLQYLTSGSDPQRVQLLPDEFYLADGNSATPSAAINLRQITFGGSLNRTITALTPVTFPSGANSRPISGIINFRQVDDVNTWHNTVNIGPANIETIPAAISASGTEEDIIPEIHLNGNVSINHGRIITGNGSGLTDISEDSLLNLGTGTSTPFPADLTATFNTMIPPNPALGERGTIQHQILLHFISEWDSAGTDGTFNPSPTSGTTVLTSGETVRIVNTNDVGTYDQVFTYSGRDFTYGGNAGGPAATDFTVHSDIRGQVLTSDGHGGFHWVDQSTIAQTHTTGGDLDTVPIDDTFVRPLLGTTSDPTEVSSSANLTYVDSTGTLTATAFVGDGTELTNVGDRFASPGIAGMNVVTGFNAFGIGGDGVVTPRFAVNINDGLNWTGSQIIHFRATFTDFGREQEAVFIGQVEDYDPMTGLITISNPQVIWVTVTGRAATGPIDITVTEVFPAGIEGPQGERGFGVSIAALPTDNGVLVTIDNEDPAIVDPPQFEITNGTDGAAGPQGPFTYSVYQVTDGARPTTVPTGFASYDSFTGRVNASDIEDNTQPTLNDGLWHNLRPDVIDTTVYVTQTTVRQLTTGQFGVAAFGPVFQAVDQGPPGDVGPVGPVGPPPDVNAFQLNLPVAVGVGDPTTALTAPVSIGDDIFVSFVGVSTTVPPTNPSDLAVGSFVSIILRNFAEGSFVSAWGRLDTITELNGNTRYGINIRAIDQNTVGSTGFPVNNNFTVSAIMNLSGFIGLTGNSHLESLADASTDDTVVQLQPATAATFNLNATAAVTVTPEPTLSNSVVPLEMVVDWVLYTSTPESGIRNLTTDAERTPTGTILIATSAIEYSNNVRLPGTWTQFIGLSHNGSTYLQDEARSVFVRSDTGTIITI